MDDVEPSLNIPSLLTLAIISFFVFRWLWSRNEGNNNAASSGQDASRVNPRHVEAVQRVFPQLTRREIMWDLRRNGGSVNATIERVLTGGGLESPPPSFEPAMPATSPRSSPSTSSSSVPTKPKIQSLIVRYNLKSRLDEVILDGCDAFDPVSDSAMKPGNSKSFNKADRHRLLQKRRDDMILAARIKMQKKMAADSQ